MFLGPTSAPLIRRPAIGLEGAEKIICLDVNRYTHKKKSQSMSYDV
jgi:hypothetical protein